MGQLIYRLLLVDLQVEDEYLFGHGGGDSMGVPGIPFERVAVELVVVDLVGPVRLVSLTNVDNFKFGGELGRQVPLIEGAELDFLHMGILDEFVLTHKLPLASQVPLQDVVVKGGRNELLLGVGVPLHVVYNPCLVAPLPS